MRGTAAGWLEDVARDVRLAWRGLRRTPGFTVTVVATLALGLALTAGAVAVVSAYLGRSLPYPASDRLYHVLYAPPGPVEPHGISALDWTVLRDVVRDPVTASGATHYVGEGADARVVRAVSVSAGFLTGLGVRIVLGRSFAADDFAPGGNRAALIGHELWREQFGGDPGVIGRELRVEVEGRDGGFETLQVVGVLAPGFWFGRDSDATVDVLRPLDRPTRTYVVRLQDGVSPARAASRLTQVVRETATWLPADWPGVTLESMRERYVGELRATLVAVAIAAGLVLAITCVNVAVLTLLRALRRGRDVAVRAVLGAGRVALLRLYLAEVALLCGAAAVAGLVIGGGVLRLLARRIAAELGRPAPGGPSALGVDWTTLLVVGAVALLVALGLAAIPALLPQRLAESLRGIGRTGTDGRLARRARSTLVALELAGSLALVAGCGLMIRSAVAMMGTDFGVNTEGLARVRVRLREAAYPDAAAFERFYRTLGDRLVARGLPRPAYASWPPFEDVPTQPIERDGLPGGSVDAGVVAVGDGYFETLGIALRRGRAFTDADRLGSEPVAVVSETLARRLWPADDAVGQRIRAVEPQQPGTPPAPWRTVVGVAADVRQTYDDADARDVYIPYFQGAPGPYGSFYLRPGARAGSTAALTRAVRSAVAEADPFAVVRDVVTVADEDRRLARARFMGSLLSGFAAFAALLAVLGIYGVVAYDAQQREREVAIRVAVGATRRAVIRLLFRDAGLVLAAGVAAGLGAAVAVARVLESQLYGVSPLDSPTLLAAGALMAVAGVLAAWLAGSRAASRSPLATIHRG